MRAGRHASGLSMLLASACALPPAEPLSRAAPATDVEASFFLIGDAGAPDEASEPVLRALRTALSQAATPATAVFLGDNIYPKGLPAESAPDREQAERRLAAQIDAVLEGGGAGIFIPGNHDWNYAGDGGGTRVVAAERFGTARGRGAVRFLPGGACPGPVAVDVGTSARLIVIDTQWWLQEAFDSPAALADCPTRSAREVLDSLTSLLEAPGRTVIVAGHHPLITHGTHGGFFTLRQHLFPLTDLKSWLWVPLPIIGSAYPVARKLGITNQDLSGSRYRRMRQALDSVFAAAPPMIYASGHEHSIQIIEGGGARYQVVSGSGYYGHNSPVTRGEGTLYHASGGSGYVRLDVQSGGRIRLAVIVVDREGGRTETWSTLLQ